MTEPASDPDASDVLAAVFPYVQPHWEQVSWEQLADAVERYLDQIDDQLRHGGQEPILPPEVFAAGRPDAALVPRLAALHVRRTELELALAHRLNTTARAATAYTDSGTDAPSNTIDL